MTKPGSEYIVPYVMEPSAVVTEVDTEITEKTEDEEILDNIDRLGIIRYVNNIANQFYDVRKDKINDYQKSLFMLSGFQTQSGVYAYAVEDVGVDIVKIINNYFEQLRPNGSYTKELQRMMENALAAQMFDVIGDKLIQTVQTELLSTMDMDID